MRAHLVRSKHYSQSGQSIGRGRRKNPIRGNGQRTFKQRRNMVARDQGRDDILDWSVYRTDDATGAEPGEGSCDQRGQRACGWRRVRKCSESRTEDHVGLTQSAHGRYGHRHDSRIGVQGRRHRDGSIRRKSARPDDDSFSQVGEDCSDLQSRTGVVGDVLRKESRIGVQQHDCGAGNVQRDTYCHGDGDPDRYIYSYSYTYRVSYQNCHIDSNHDGDTHCDDDVEQDTRTDEDCHDNGDSDSDIDVGWFVDADCDANGYAQRDTFLDSVSGQRSSTPMDHAKRSAAAAKLGDVEQPDLSARVTVGVEPGGLDLQHPVFSRRRA